MCECTCFLSPSLSTVQCHGQTSEKQCAGRLMIAKVEWPPCVLAECISTCTSRASDRIVARAGIVLGSDLTVRGLWAPLLAAWWGGWPLAGEIQQQPQAVARDPSSRLSPLLQLSLPRLRTLAQSHSLPIEAHYIGPAFRGSTHHNPRIGGPSPARVYNLKTAQEL